MGGSLRLAKIAGIPVYVHWTFLILLGWVGFTYYARGNDIGDAIHGIVFILALFMLVVLHEFGHALAARRYGIPTKDITLLPIGGVARLQRMPEKPSQELVVALAGPAVNVVLAIVCFLAILGLTGAASFSAAIDNGVEELGFVAEDYEKVEKAGDYPIFGRELLSRLLVVNIALVAFNMLPAFPMDGGRVLRAFLAMNMDYVRATRVAASVGQMMAVVLGFLGLVANPFLVFIALFVWMGAAAESSAVQIRAGLQGIPVSHAMITDFKTLAPTTPLGDVSKYVVAGYQHDFPVTDDYRLVGVLTKSDLLRALAERGPEELVGNVMRREFCTARPTDMLDSLFSELQQFDCHSAPVTRNGDLLGLVTLESVGEFLALQSALRDRAARGRGAY